MRRLITALLCLFSLSGTYAGHAQASQKAGHEAGLQAGLQARPAYAASFSGSLSDRDQAAAVDPAWVESAAPIVLAPTSRTLPPNSAQTHFAGIAAAWWATYSRDSAHGRASASRNAGWAVISRGYRATGPPAPAEILLARTSLARPA